MSSNNSPPVTLKTPTLAGLPQIQQRHTHSTATEEQNYHNNTNLHHILHQFPVIAFDKGVPLVNALVLCEYRYTSYIAEK